MTKNRVRSFSRVTQNIELDWIPLEDGRRLAARLVLPKNAERQPVPAILEYIPYRRRDGTRARDEGTMHWFAANGYGYARVDISGSGDSDGLIEDEYVKREQDDGVEIIAWLAAQPWCSGSVGMIGISWGGFNGLQIAARRPPALKAVVSLCSTVDRYHDDVHYMGGCLLGDTMDWGSAFFTIGALPPDPKMAGERRWRRLWRERVEGLELYPAIWMKHQRRDDFWRHGSVIENYDAIKVPVLGVSGWSDGYTAAVFRLVENLRTPCKGLVGPWGHKYPHQGVPGPAIGFLQECKRWWDRWLKGEPNGVEKTPDLRLFMQDSEKPQAHFDERRGQWLGIARWPSAKITPERYFFSREGLSNKAGRHALGTVKSPQITGLTGGEWCAYALGKVAPELPLDQRADDAGSLVYETPPIKRELRIVGRSVVKLRIAADRAQAFVVVRLNDVAPDGSVARITYGMLNLTHRNSHARPVPLRPGKFYDVHVELNEIAQSLPAGHRLRISISSAYWPMVWPSPHPVTLTVDTKGSVLELPLLRSETGLKPVTFDPVESASPLKTTVHEPGNDERSISHDIANGRTEFISSRDDGRYTIDDIGTEIAYTKRKVFSIQNDDPLSAEASVVTTMHYRREDWDARVETETRLRCDERRFYLTATVRTFDRGKSFVERRFRHSFARDHL